MRISIGVGLLLLVLVGAASAVQATDGPSAVYTGTTESGAITVTAAPGSLWQIFAEQPDASYAMVAGGRLAENGTATASVVPSGPVNNGQPMFMIRVTAPDGSWVMTYVSSPDDDHQWGWL